MTYSIWDSYYPGPMRKQAEITEYENHLSALGDDWLHRSYLLNIDNGRG